MSDADHPTGIETRECASGWQAVLHNGDGTSVKFWGPTEQQAERRAQEADAS